MRGFLADDYGVDLAEHHVGHVRGPHLAEYREPPNVERAAEGKQLKQMLLDGEIDAAILGDVAEQGPLKHLIPDHAAEGQRWARTHGGVAINHMAVIRQSIAQSRPDVVREVYRMLTESRAAAALPAGAGRPAALRRGRDPASLEHMVAYAFQQGLITRRPTADELFADAARILGAGGGADR